MKLIVCTTPEGIETWIDYPEIAAMAQTEIKNKMYTRVLLKSGAELIVEDTPEDIHNCIIEHDEYSAFFYVGRS